MTSKHPIPTAVLAQHIAIIGKTGSGKTSTGKLLVEQVVPEGARVCILDPIKSDWWGLTSSSDGKNAGLPFQILGGPHGHVPLHASAGKAIGEIVAGGSLPLSIIDMADFEAGGVQRFFVDFAPALLRYMRGVLYLVIEEAHEFAPKERAGFGAENMAIHFAKKLATAGRSKGIRLVVMTHAVQQLHNRVLGSCDTLIAQRLTAPADQKPVLDWLKSNVSDKAMQKEIAGSLSSLKTGTGWLCAGELGKFERVAFPRISTYDNSATPTGDAREHLVKTAPVDVEKLRSIIGTAVTEAEANDPRVLKRRIADLERQARAAQPAATSALPSKDELTAAEARGIARGVALAAKEVKAIMPGLRQDIIGSIRSRSAEMIGDAEGALTGLLAAVSNAAQGHIASAPESTERRVSAARPTGPVTGSEPRNARAARLHRQTDGAAASNGDRPPVQQRVLDALAELEQIGAEQPAREMVAFMAGYSHLQSTGFVKAMGGLRTAGLIDYPPHGGTVALTDAGRTVATPPERPRTPEELQARVVSMLGGPTARILKPLLAAYPKALDRIEVAAAAGYGHLQSTGFVKAMGKLRTLGFIDYPDRGTVVAKPVLFLE